MVWHALASYRHDGAMRTALVLEATLHDLEQAADALSVTAEWTRASVAELLERWTRVRPGIDALARAAAAQPGRVAALSLGPGDLGPPFRPTRIFCAAANYAKHAREMGTVLAEKAERNPYMFMKTDSAIIGHNDTVILPRASSQVDWEIELAVVIGKTARHVPAQRALHCVAGYTIINDISARDLNVRDDYPFRMDWFQGKCFDTFAPLGPWLVPAACIDDPYALNMRLTVNGTPMQEELTGAMIFDIGEQIEYLSSVLTLQPGDVIATGTPTGVGMSRGVFLAPGDVMEATIAHIGCLRNPVSRETASEQEARE
ncbi:MAG: fumarylacetoacetate hydrolase family protein [Rhodospirillaceae bacterium]|nr:fumarylacetoacetate hydrolase family protein [Rhodospirillaceae bacterium]